jgi:hypothetical protein
MLHMSILIGRNELAGPAAGASVIARFIQHLCHPVGKSVQRAANANHPPRGSGRASERVPASA